MRILVVEDDTIIGDGLLTALKLEGYAVDWVKSKESATLAIETHKYDMILMDIGLPDGSGIDLLTEIRSSKNQVPILMLTAYDKTNYKVEGLNAGADDYLVKPFKMLELKARIRALHRRRIGKSQSLLTGNGISLNMATKTITVENTVISLSPKEFLILQLLMEKPNEIISKNMIEDGIYGWGMEIESNTIEVHISKIRKKLGRAVIKTVKNMGYRFAHSA